MSGKAVATAKSAVPALVTTPALEIGAEDIALPRLYIGQYMSDAVKDRNIDVGAGDIFVASGKDDPDPQVLWVSGSDKPGPVVHVLSLRRGKSISEGGELVLFDYNDPDAPPEAWVTYNYMVAIPSFDEEIPVKWLLTRTGKPAAQQMNTVIKKNEGRGPAWLNAFEVTTDMRENKKGEYFVPRVRKVEADDASVKVAESLAAVVASQPIESYSNGDEPAI